MKRLLLVLLFGMVSVAGAYVITQRQQKQYRATAVIQILPPRMSGGQDVFTPMIVNDNEYLNTQLVIMQQYETIQRAVKEHIVPGKDDFAGKTLEDIVRLAMGHVECSRRRGL